MQHPTQHTTTSSPLTQQEEDSIRRQYEIRSTARIVQHAVITSYRALGLTMEQALDIEMRSRGYRG